MKRISSLKQALAPLRRAWNFLLMAAVCAGLLAAPQAVYAHQPSADPSDPAELAAFMDGLMAAQMTVNHVPGAVVVVVKDGEVFFAKGYGYADVEQRTPVDPADTLFRPGSISKLFTWTAVMQLAEQGRLALDEDITTYLDFPIPATFPEPITMLDLMAHTPGFEDRGDGLFKLKPEQMVSLETYVKTNMPARVFPPGKISAYSNYGVALAGYIVQRVSSQPFDEYVEEHIFSPLGMTHATFRQPLPDNLAADMSGGYNYANGGYLRGAFEYVTGYPAGAMSVSGLDMAHFMIAHLQNGRYGDQRILGEATAAQMHTQSFTPDPRLTGMAHGFFENVINGQRVLSHGGATVLFHSELFLIPDQNLGLFISTNAVGGGGTPEQVGRAFIERYYPQLEFVAEVTADTAARAAAYAGSYTSSRSNFTTLEKFLNLANPINVSVNADGSVVIASSSRVVRFVEIEPGLLQSPEYPEQKAVLRQENGRVTIIPVGPSVLIKAPWYERLALHLLILFGGGLLNLVTLIVWGIGALRRRKQGQPAPLPARVSRWVAALFGVCYLAGLVMFGAALGDVDPVYAVPNFFFEVPGWFDGMIWLFRLAGLLGLATLPLLVLVLWKRYGSRGERLYSALLSLAALAISWSLWFWNFMA